MQLLRTVDNLEDYSNSVLSVGKAVYSLHQQFKQHATVWSVQDSVDLVQQDRE